jgi:hypothetical protein
MVKHGNTSRSAAPEFRMLGGITLCNRIPRIFGFAKQPDQASPRRCEKLCRPRPVKVKAEAMLMVINIMPPTVPRSKTSR